MSCVGPDGSWPSSQGFRGAVCHRVACCPSCPSDSSRSMAMGRLKPMLGDGPQDTTFDIVAVIIAPARVKPEEERLWSLSAARRSRQQRHTKHKCILTNVNIIPFYWQIVAVQKLRTVRGCGTEERICHFDCVPGMPIATAHTVARSIHPFCPAPMAANTPINTRHKCIESTYQCNHCFYWQTVAC